MPAQTDPHLFYPKLYSPALSPEGQFFVLVGNVMLANGAIAASIDLQTASTTSFFYLMLPTRVEAKNPENLEGYLVPGAMAGSAHAISEMSIGIVSVLGEVALATGVLRMPYIQPALVNSLHITQIFARMVEGCH